MMNRKKKSELKKKPPDFRVLKERSEEGLRDAAVRQGMPEAAEKLVSGSILDLSRFNLTADGEICEGIVAVTEEFLVSCAKAGDRESFLALRFDEIENLSLRAGFGAYAIEAVCRDGSVKILCRTSMKYGKLFTAFFKRAELYLTDKEVYARRREDEMPAFCPKCGRPLRAGSTSCDRCADKMKLMKRIVGMAVPHKTAIIVVTLIYLLTLAINLVEPYVNRVLVDSFINN